MLQCCLPGAFQLTKVTWRAPSVLVRSELDELVHATGGRSLAAFGMVALLLSEC